MPRQESTIDRETLFEKLEYTPQNNGQWDMHNSDARFRTACCGRRWGKALKVDTPILTTSGWKTMLEIQSGDVVFDELGRPCNVIGATEVMYGRPCYRVKFNDGSELVADALHQWLTWDKKARKAVSDPRRHTQPDIRTTGEIANTLTVNGENNHAIQVTQPVELTAKNLIVDPYVLGAWLGDGNSSTGQITCHSNGFELLGKILDAGYEVNEVESSKYLYNIVGLKSKLRELSVLSDKHIPYEYLYGSIEQRSELLKGLMDTDGTCGSNGQVEFANTNEDLALGVFWLCTSLGMIPKMYSKFGTLNGKTYKKVFRIRFMPNRAVFNITYKLERQMSAQGRGLNRYLRYITSCEPIESVPVKCISVDSPSHLFLAGHTLIPTHNSLWAGHEMTVQMFTPDTINWIVGPKYVLAEREFRVVHNDFKKLGLLGRCKHSYNIRQGDMKIYFKDLNSLVLCVSAEKQDSLVGEGLSHVIMSEAAKHKLSTWQMYIEPALSDLRGSADFPSTPQGFNWFKGLYDLGQSPDQPEYASWHFPTWTNTFRFPGGFDDPELVRIRNARSNLWWDQEYGAKFTAYEGLIFQNFDPQVHVRPITYEPAWENWLAIDFGFKDPTVCLDIMVHPATQRVYVWREYYVTQKISSDHAVDIRNREHPTGYHYDFIACDPRSPDERITMEFLLGGMLANAMGRSLGFEAIAGALKNRDDGEPGLIIDPSCKFLIDEMASIHAKPTNENRNERPGTLDTEGSDHSVDALRYFFNERFVLGGGEGLADIYNDGQATEADTFFNYVNNLTMTDNVGWRR